MKALKDHVSAYLEGGEKIVSPGNDTVLTELKSIVGDFWATNVPQ